MTASCKCDGKRCAVCLNVNETFLTNIPNETNFHQFSDPWVIQNKPQI